jgi:hypothetical protein
VFREEDRGERLYVITPVRGFFESLIETRP